MKWKDTTSFSQSDKERIPATFRLKIGGLMIVVTRHRYYAPDEWILKCDPWFSEMVISKGTAE